MSCEVLPREVLVVVGVVFQAAVQDPDETVGVDAKGLGMGSWTYRKSTRAAWGV
jgi:hypothetical protein